MKTLLAELDPERVAEAVANAEERTAGEIVPVVIPKSGSYDVAVWRGASALALLAMAVVLLVVRFYTGWGLGWLFTAWGPVLVVSAAGTVGALLGAYLPPVQRALVGDDQLDRTVHQRALQAFVEEEVFATRDRTGILLFVSLREHRIEVLGDTGINQAVEPDDWADVVARIRTSIKNEQLTSGLVDAIGMCGRLLERKGVDVHPDDEDELSNRLRTPDS